MVVQQLVVILMFSGEGELLVCNLRQCCSKYHGFLFFCLFRATPAAYGSSQARGQIKAAAAGLAGLAGLHHSYSNARSQLSLRPTQQLRATPDP